MYRTALLKHFTAQHFHAGSQGDSEAGLHLHRYTLELCVEGPELNARGYLIDLAELDRSTQKVLEQFKDRALIDLPEFSGMDPSLERLAAYICDNVDIEQGEIELASINVKVWESDQAWASCKRDLQQIP